MHHLARGLAVRHGFFCTLPELPRKLQALVFQEAVVQPAHLYDWSSDSFCPIYQSFEVDFYFGQTQIQQHCLQQQLLQQLCPLKAQLLAWILQLHETTLLLDLWPCDSNERISQASFRLHCVERWHEEHWESKKPFSNQCLHLCMLSLCHCSHASSNAEGFHKKILLLRELHEHCFLESEVSWSLFLWNDHECTRTFHDVFPFFQHHRNFCMQLNLSELLQVGDGSGTSCCLCFSESHVCCHLLLLFHFVEW